MAANLIKMIVQRKEKTRNEIKYSWIKDRTITIEINKF